MLLGFVGSVGRVAAVLKHAVCRVGRVVCLVDVEDVMLGVQVDVAELGRESRAVQRARARNLRARCWLTYHGTGASWLHISRGLITTPQRDEAMVIAMAAAWLLLW